MTDIHSHLFNLKYLPVAGIIRKYTNYKVPLIIVNPVSRLLLKHTRSDIFINGENTAEMNTAVKLHEKIKLKKFGKYNKPFSKLTQEEIVNLMVDEFTPAEINTDEMKHALIEYYKIIGDLNKVAEIENIYINISREGSDEINLGNMVSLSGSIKSMIDWFFKLIKKGENFIRWVYLMQHSETDIYETLKINVPDMKYYVHHMMDVDNYFEGDSTFDFVTKQIPNMQRLNEMFKDKLIGFVAYDPQKENCLKIVKDAVEKRGFKGVKFYPPMGYRALGNTNENIKYNQRNEALFSYCIEKDLPIFTHCNNQGFEAAEHSGYNSNPLFWEMVLKQEKFKTLRLNLAHAGGIQGWFCEVVNDEQVKVDIIDNNIYDADGDQTTWNRSYAKLVYKLCVVYPNVYCDAAYLDEVLDVNLIKNFKQRLVKLFNSEPKFIEKIMFGTDWHMLYQDGENETFYTAYKKLFNSPELLPYNARFFEENALRYLKMTNKIP